MNAEEALSWAEDKTSFRRPTTIAALYKWIKETTLLIKDFTPQHKARLTDMKEWAIAWNRLSDNLDREVAEDPLLLYVPANKMSREFHSSPAFARMICSANRTSKTASIMAEGAGLLTGRDWGRKKSLPPADIFQIGVDFQKYAPNVWEKKLVFGEPGCSFTPMFPEGGKWFYHYDDRKKRLTLACPQCANARRAKLCKHTKSTWTLFSDNEGAKVLQGGAYKCGIYDEELSEEFWTEGYQRLQTVADSFILVGFTPLKGPDLWPHKKIAARAKGPKELNRMKPNDENSQPFASYHTCTQKEGGLVPPDKVDAARATMDEAEASARLDGEPIPIVEHPVFSRKLLGELRKVCGDPLIRGNIRQIKVVPNGNKTESNRKVDYVFPDETENFSKFDMHTQFDMVAEPEGNLRVWQRPIDGYLYIAAVDCAIGLASGDPACMSVFRVTPGLKGTQLAMVAQYHGWINSFDYASEIFKIAIWYNSALVAIENTGGYGEATTLKLKEYGYWNLYVDEQDRTKTKPGPESRIGMNTNAGSKPFMVSAAQRFVIEHAIDIPCEDTIREMLAFEQVRNAFGTSRYRGAAGTHDDRCMSLIIGCSVAVSYPLYRWEVLKSLAQVRDKPNLSPEWQAILAEREAEAEDEYGNGAF